MCISLRSGRVFQEDGRYWDDGSAVSVGHSFEQLRTPQTRRPCIDHPLGTHAPCVIDNVLVDEATGGGRNHNV